MESFANPEGRKNDFGIPIGDIDELSSIALPIIRKHASTDLLAKVHPDMLIGPLPNDGIGTFDQDALRVMASAMLNYFERTGNDMFSAPFGVNEEDSYALIYLPKDRQTVLDSYELTLAQ